MKLNNPFPSSSLNTICIQPVNLRIFVQITIVQFTVLLVPASVGAYRRVASIGPSPQVFVSSLLSTDLSSSSAYCSSRARAFPPSPVTSWSTWSPSQRKAGWGRESSSALTVRRVSDRMLLISCWSSLGCCPDCSTWLRWMFALERHTGSLCQKCLRSIDVFVFFGLFWYLINWLWFRFSGSDFSNVRIFFYLCLNINVNNEVVNTKLDQLGHLKSSLDFGNFWWSPN